jgi:integrase
MSSAKGKAGTGVRKIGEQHYRLSYVERGTGQRRQPTVKGTLEEAKAKRAALTDSQRTGEYVPPDKITLRQYCDAWLDTREIMGTTKRSTQLRSRQLLDAVCAELGDVRLQELTKRMVEDYYVKCLRHEITLRGKPVSRDTVNKRHKELKKALEDAVHEEPPLIPRNPAAQAKHPTPSKPHGQAFTREEAQAVRAAVHDSWVDLPVRIALDTGLRLGEVTALRWKHLDLPDDGGGKLTVAGIVTETDGGFVIAPYAKTGHSRRTIAFGAALADTLRQHRKAQLETRLKLGPAWQQNDLVVCGEYGQLLRPSKVTARFTPILRVMEEDGVLTTTAATFHTLRHTHATLLLRAGKPVGWVSKRLGHSKVQITLDYYSHVIPGDDEALAETFDGIMAEPYEPPTKHTLSTDKAATEGVAALL